MIVVADTSPLNYLVLIDAIKILPDLFGQVIVPEAVWTELAADGSPEQVKVWTRTRPGWIEIESPMVLDTTIKLGDGEVEAISLAKEVGADLVLVDDRKARLAAMERGLVIAGTINVLESAAKRGMIDLEQSFHKLQQTNFRIARPLLDEILLRNR